MSLDAFANSMDSMFAEPSGVSNSSLSMRANTDYDMDDFTGRHEHKVGGTNSMFLNFINQWFIYAILFIYLLAPIHVATATGQNSAKGYAFLIIIGVFILLPFLAKIVMIGFFPEQDLFSKLPCSTQILMYCVGIMIITTLILVSAIQLYNNPKPGLTVMNIAFVSILYVFTYVCILVIPTIESDYGSGTLSRLFRSMAFLTCAWCGVGLILPTSTAITTVNAVLFSVAFLVMCYCVFFKIP